jgi:Ca2+-binding EF-hand superfamily protein
MRGTGIIARAAGTGLLCLCVIGVVRGADKPLAGPIDSLEDLESTGRMLFKLADTNNDNLISQKEATDAGNLLVGGFFFRADANGDGKVTSEEARSARESLFNQRPLLRFIFQRGAAEIREHPLQSSGNQPQPRLTDMLDGNHDGTYSAAELRQTVATGVQALFLTADINRDSQLDPSEINQAVVEVGRSAAQSAFAATDTDHNGALSQDEFDKAVMIPAHVVFRILDANDDHQLSADELKSGGQILIREIRALRVPEAPNSISGRLNQAENTSGTALRPVVKPPLLPVRAVTPAPRSVTPTPPWR